MAKLLDIIGVRVQELLARTIVHSQPLNGWLLRNAKHLGPGEYEYLDSEWRVLNEHDIWAKQGMTAFMQRTVQIPEDFQGYKVGLQIITGGEGLLTLDGEPYHGVDDNRGYILLAKSCNGSESFDCSIEIKTGGYLEYVGSDPEQPFLLSKSRLLAIDQEVEETYLDFKAVHASAAAMKDPLLQEAVLAVMKEALYLIDFRFPNKPEFKYGLQQARALLWNKLDNIEFSDNPGSNFMCGHSHIDVAWLWPLKETMRKVGRTYSTVTTLMDEYPDYHFVCSQVPLLVFLKEHWPSIYEKVKQRVAEGRFEPIGGTWVENDCNVVSGESMVRQCLYGKRFFSKEFGFDVRVGWLPDVFGYSWAMPQIYKQAGLDYFMTSKISWNDTNRFPYNTFWWKGIDGTEVFTQFVHGTYNAMVTPAEIQQTWSDYNSKLSCPEYLTPYGFGDGGGGPTREMLEMLPRLADIPGLPKVKVGKTHEFFDRIAANTSELPVWNGELYFELHRGTYTSQSRNKRYNRKAENTCREAEMLGAVSGFFGGRYQKELLAEHWQTILLNQFHDIIPGSSITAVYEDSTSQYENLITSAEHISEEALAVVAGQCDTSGYGQPVVVFNTLSWQHKGLVTLDWNSEEPVKVVSAVGVLVPSQLSGGKLIFEADVCSCGCTVYYITPSQSPAQSPFETNGSSIKTPYYELELDSHGAITSLRDIDSDRQVLPEGSRANVLQVFEDKPSNWEAWDVEVQYQDKVWEFTSAAGFKVVENGAARLVLEGRLDYGCSTIDQQIILYSGSRRIDFVNRVDWKERKTLLKVAMPVDIHTTKATYEIAFGAIERPNHWNTSWDRARFEVSGHRWADLSEADYGVSVLNDCKYGWDIKDNVIRLSLLRSPESPDPVADLGEHFFTYSLLPHCGDWKNGSVQAGMELNIPLTAVLEPSHSGAVGSYHSFMSVDKPNVIIDTIKQAEDSEEMIVRLYESVGARCPVTLTCDRTIKAAVQTNLLEEETAAVSYADNALSFPIKPFEIITIKLTF